jgi:predicted phosphoribosyltransferase
MGAEAGPPRRFRDRRDAGRALGERLGAQLPPADAESALVLALPRGGVPVGFEVATALGAPLDVFLVRKLGVPGHRELAMGALASGGVRVLNPAVVDALGLPGAVLDAVAAREQAELERRARAYRGDRPPPAVRGRTAVLVDDGLATGSTMRAARHLAPSAAAWRRLSPQVRTGPQRLPSQRQQNPRCRRQSRRRRRADTQSSLSRAWSRGRRRVGRVSTASWWRSSRSSVGSSPRSRRAARSTASRSVRHSNTASGCRFARSPRCQSRERTIALLQHLAGARSRC